MGMQIVVNHHVMLGIEYGSWEEQVVLVASEPSLQPLVEIIKWSLEFLHPAIYSSSLFFFLNICFHMQKIRHKTSL